MSTKRISDIKPKIKRYWMKFLFFCFLGSFLIVQYTSSGTFSEDKSKSKLLLKSDPPLQLSQIILNNNASSSFNSSSSNNLLRYEPKKEVEPSMKGGGYLAPPNHPNSDHLEAISDENNPLSFHSDKEVHDDDERMKSLMNKEELSELQLIEKIKEFKNPKNEKRVISFGLYGSKPKYTTGAIRNAELRDTYFPGWEVWYYYDDQVPKDIIEKLNQFPNVTTISCGRNNGISGMFWRFQVADDEKVDRYIVRDADSRLNSRERMAVEEWIESNVPVHLLRDHVNHCHAFNGGMWGGTKGAFQDIGGLVPGMNSILKGKQTNYMGDMNFLNENIYPSVKEKTFAHDAYCCGKFINSKPFPTKRPSNYQHVGQVFDANDKPRMSDIDGFIRGKVIPTKCRRKEEWKFG